MLNAPLATKQTVRTAHDVLTPIATQKVVIVNGSPEILGLLDGVLEVYSDSRDKVKLEALALIIWGL